MALLFYHPMKINGINVNVPVIDQDHVVNFPIGTTAPLLALLDYPRPSPFQNTFVIEGLSVSLTLVVDYSINEQNRFKVIYNGTVRKNFYIVGPQVYPWYAVIYKKPNNLYTFTLAPINPDMQFSGVRLPSENDIPIVTMLSQGSSGSQSFSSDLENINLVSIGYRITFNTNGGTPVPALENQTNLPDPLPTTTLADYVFTGWYTDSSLIFPAIPGAAITSDTTLYAGWRRAYPGPGSDTGGGEGTYDDSSDDIATAAPPLTDVTNTKFLTLWEATSTQLDTLAADLWSTAFNTGIFKNQRDPFEALISLHQMPLPPDQIAAGNIKIGNYEPNPAIQMTRIKQYKTLYCGSVEVPEYWGNALDYNGGGTRLEIYLPYIGTRELDPDDFVGGRCHVTYTVDMLTGACVAQVRANRTDPDSGNIDSVLYVYSGVCGVEIPLSGSSHSVTVGNIIAGIAAAGGAVVSVATGGMALPALGAVAGAAGSIAANANKTHVSRSGGVSQNAGIMSPQKPYLIISRPVQQTPDQIKRFSGFPSYVTGPLSGFSGFTKVFRVHVDVTATEAEREEIENLLKQGVIL